MASANGAEEAGASAGGDRPARRPLGGGRCSACRCWCRAWRRWRAPLVAGSSAPFILGLLMVAAGAVQAMQVMLGTAAAGGESAVLRLPARRRSPPSAGVLLLVQPQLVFAGLAVLLGLTWVVDGVGKVVDRRARQIPADSPGRAMPRLGGAALGHRRRRWSTSSSAWPSRRSGRCRGCCRSPSPSASACWASGGRSSSVGPRTPAPSRPTRPPTPTPTRRFGCPRTRNSQRLRESLIAEEADAPAHRPLLAADVRHHLLRHPRRPDGGGVGPRRAALPRHRRRGRRAASRWGWRTWSSPRSSGRGGA